MSQYLGMILVEESMKNSLRRDLENEIDRREM
jgi:hypothetical protein